MTEEAGIYSGEKTVSLISDTRKTGKLHKNETRTVSNITHKLNPKSINGVLNVELDALRLLEENIDVTPLYINRDRIFLDSFPNE